MGKVLVFAPRDIYTLSSPRWLRSSGISLPDQGGYFAILFKAKKMESTIYVDTRPPYFEEVARKSYPVHYTPPIFPKYEGITRNDREHIRQYVDALMAHSHDQELRLREFSKS